MKNMKLYSIEEIKDELLGKIGTPERDKHEREVEKALLAARTNFASTQANKEPSKR